MTLEEATALAAEIEASGTITVTAIGRFVLPIELQQAHRNGYLHKLPWCVAAVAVADIEYRGVLRSPEQWPEFLACQIACQNSAQICASPAASTSAGSAAGGKSKSKQATPLLF
jgi:hypothetical protein